MRGTYQKNQTSRAAAIKSFCQECMGYSREEVKKCAAQACPLYAFRPYQGESEADEAVSDEAVSA